MMMVVHHKRKDVSSDWFADKWDERSVSGHAKLHKGRMKGDDNAIDTEQTPKCLHGRLPLLEKLRKAITNIIPNKTFEVLLLFYTIDNLRKIKLLLDLHSFIRLW